MQERQPPPTSSLRGRKGVAIRPLSLPCRGLRGGGGGRASARSEGDRPQVVALPPQSLRDSSPMLTHRGALGERIATPLMRLAMTVVIHSCFFCFDNGSHPTGSAGSVTPALQRFQTLFPFLRIKLAYRAAPPHPWATYTTAASASSTIHLFRCAMAYFG